MLKHDHLDVVLSLVDRKGNPTPAKLCVRINADALKNTFNFLTKRLELLVKIADEVADVCFFRTFSFIG